MRTLQRLPLTLLLASAACGGGVPSPETCQTGQVGQGPSPDTGEGIYWYSVECDTATYRAVCEPLDEAETRYRVQCAYGTFDDDRTVAGGEVTSTFEAAECPRSLDPVNVACDYEIVPRSR